MKFPVLSFRRLRECYFLIFSTFFLAAVLPAQTPSTGTIAGRVFNPATGKYVRNAEVRLVGTNRVVASSGDGTFSFTDVPVGPATVEVVYTGYETTTLTLDVAPGTTAKADVDLHSSLYKSEAEGGQPIKLDEFVVSTQREGNAKAIMDQKQSMNVSNIVAAEAFGNTAEGNVGEFLKYLPAIQLDYVEADARNPRIRGMPAQYTTVTFAGMNLASADGFIQNNGTDNGGGAGAGGRSFGFEQVSMSSVDAVDVSFTTNASQSAGSAAGSIDLRPKHAYETSGQRLIVDMSAMANSEELYWHKAVKPDDRPRRLIMPNGSVEYSNSFFNHRLGVIVSVNESNIFNEQRQFVPTYDATPTAADPRPLVLTRIQYKDGPKLTERSTFSSTLDFKATEQLSFTLISTLNNYGMFTSNRSFGVTSIRANIKGDGLTSWGNTAITALTNTQAYLRKRTRGYTYLPMFAYKTDRLLIEGAAVMSASENDYAGNQSYQLPGNNIAGVSLAPAGIIVSASRGDDLYSWNVTQTAGADWANITNYKAAATAYPTFGYDGRYNRVAIAQGRLDARYITPLQMPTWIKAGANVSETVYTYRNTTTWQSWNYVGPGGGLGGSWANYPSAAVFDPGHGAFFTSSTGGSPAIWNHNVIGQLFKSNPEYFVQNATPANFLSSFITSPKYIKERVDALYAMFDTKPTKALEVQAGVRWERTDDKTKDFVQKPASQVIAAGYPVNATTGVATTIPGLQYQYLNGPRSVHQNRYSEFFPSAGIKYSITPNLQALFGYSYTVTRPAFGDLSGTYSENESTQEINAPNPLLKPQYSNNFSARAMYYFEPVGSFGVGVFENDIKNFTQTSRIRGNAGDFGFTDPIYDTYTVVQKNSLPGTVIYRGATMEYQQSLSFLPKPFDGLGVFANYTRTYTKMDIPDPPQLLLPGTPYNFGWIPGVAPHVINAGVNYKYRRLSMSLNAHWTADMPTTSTYNTWMQQNTKYDLNVSYELTNHFSIYFYSRNITNEPDHTYIGRNRDLIGGGRAIEYYGAYLYAGIRAKF